MQTENYFLLLHSESWSTFLRTVRNKNKIVSTYGASSEKTTAITSKTPSLAFSSYTGIEKINLQWNIATPGSIKVRSVNLVKHDNTLEPCDLELIVLLNQRTLLNKY